MRQALRRWWRKVVFATQEELGLIPSREQRERLASFWMMEWERWIDWANSPYNDDAQTIRCILHAGECLDEAYAMLEGHRGDPPPQLKQLGAGMSLVGSKRG